MERELLLNHKQQRFFAEQSQRTKSFIIPKKASTKKQFEVSEEQQLQKIEVLAVLGKGAQGEVVLCRSEQQQKINTYLSNGIGSNHTSDINFSNQKPFVIKIIDNKQYENVKKMNQQHQQNIQTEFKIMNKLRNDRRQIKAQMVRSSYQKIHQNLESFNTNNSDPQDNFFSDTINQEESIQRIQECISQDATKFYSANVIIGLKRLHELNILYRDLKPENILIDKQGYCKLSDFGLSAILSDESIQQQQQNININQNCENGQIQKKPALKLDDIDFGTPEYLPPECYQGQEFTQAGDWWGLGCFIYEIVTGSPPFFNLDIKRLSTKIIYTDPNYKIIDDQDLKDLIQKLLTKDPIQRMKNIQEIENHLWFKDLNWNNILQRKVQAPYVPKPIHITSSLQDLSNQIYTDETSQQVNKDISSSICLNLKNFSKDATKLSIEGPQRIIDSIFEERITQIRSLRHKIREAMKSYSSSGSSDEDEYKNIGMDQDYISNSSMRTCRSTSRSISPSSKKNSGSRASQLFNI
eukprot:403375011